MARSATMILEHPQVEDDPPWNCVEPSKQTSRSKQTGTALRYLLGRAEAS